MIKQIITYNKSFQCALTHDFINACAWASLCVYHVNLTAISLLYNS